LRAEIARGILHASVLVIPWRKTALVRALHGRRPWRLVGEEGRERGRGAQLLGGARWEGGILEGGSVAAPLSVLLVSACYTWEESRKEEGEEKRDKRKEEGKKTTKEKRKIFQTWKFSKRKRKDNLWSLSKIIFVKEGYMSNYK
jgi:hypothetical protein